MSRRTLSRWSLPKFRAPPESQLPQARKLCVADKRRLQELLHQQMWCWGRDVKHSTPPGNLLIWAGMTRHGGTTPGEAGSNRYSIDLPAGFAISLWAFGIVATDSAGNSAVLHRYQRAIRLLPKGWRPDDVRTPEQLPRSRRPVTTGDRQRASAMLDVILRWIESYERAVAREFGSGYRVRTLDGWEHPIVPGEAMADEWQRVAATYRRAGDATTSRSLLSFGRVVTGAGVPR